MLMRRLGLSMVLALAVLAPGCSSSPVNLTPGAMPSAKPTVTPSSKPTATPSPKPTATPSVKPTATPSVKPTATPSPKPTATPSPTPRPDRNFKVLYDFKTNEAPYGGVTALNGSLYGSFYEVKGYGAGVYVLNASGAERVLNANFLFTGEPTAINGLLYLIGYVGNLDNASAGLYSMTPSGSSKLISSFSGVPVFTMPVGKLISVDGTLYATDLGDNTDAEDESNFGSEYAVSPTGTSSVLYHFTGSNAGEYPAAGLLYWNGNLYGTTSCYQAYYENYDCGGSVFSLTLAGTETTLYQFKVADDGLGPFSSLIYLHGLLYGTTAIGGRGNGTVFAISPSGAEHVVYAFKGEPDGSEPMANLTAVGDALYGTTVNGGANGLGTIFRVSTSGTEEVVHSFSQADGAHPYSGLIYQGGMLYGTTTGGGAAGSGTVFQRKL